MVQGWKRNRRAPDETSYNKLSPNQIRLVKIKPATAQYPVCVKLKTVDLRSTKYTALSYTWELDTDEAEVSINDSGSSQASAEATHTILCDGCPTRVTKCLWDVLAQLRDLDCEVPIWIDRLSIDFDNHEERTSQTGMMGTIYAKASHVVVWLGTKIPSSDETVLIMRKIVNCLNWRKMPQDFRWDFRDPRIYKYIGIDRVSVQQWRNIYQFCSARWFTRLWAFHELASARQAVFLHGDRWMDYDFLIDFAMVMGISGWLDSLASLTTDSIEVEEGSVALTRMLSPIATLRAIPVWHPKHTAHAQWMQDEYKLTTESERAWKFLELMLQTCEGFECQDPRDRIFASLALVRTMFQGRPIEKEWPAVDYTRSVDEVYTHFTNLIQKYTHAPSILATAQNHIQPVFTIGRGRSSIKLITP